MRLVRTLKYFWKYQKPKVEVIEHADWAMPRYVNWRNEKLIKSFWIIDTSVPVIHKLVESCKGKATRPAHQ